MQYQFLSFLHHKVSNFQLSMQRLCAYQLECHGYTTLCFLSNLSGVSGIQQQIPMPVESSSVEQSEFREVVCMAVLLIYFRV